MTYKQIVDRFKEIVRDHNQLQDFGYGQLSDIKTRHEGGTTSNADYPYLFLNYTSHTRSQQMITYNFNMIVMDMVKDDNFLKVQSDCQQYIDDVLARLRFYYTDRLDIDLSSISLTPFKERFQDTVAGMTATISLQAPVALNECIAPFDLVDPCADGIQPIVDFSVEGSTTVNVGNVVQFINNSELQPPQCGTIFTYEWTTLGGSPGVYIQQVGLGLNDPPPAVTYDEEGVYDVNVCMYWFEGDEYTGTTNSICLTKTDFITVESVQQETLIVDVGNSVPFAFDPETTPGVPSYDTIYLNDGNFDNNNFWRPILPGTYKFTWEGELYSGPFNPGDQWANPLTMLHESIPNIQAYNPDVVVGWPTGDQTAIVSANAIPIRLEWNNITPTSTAGFLLNFTIDDPTKPEGTTIVKDPRWKIYRIS